MECLECIEVVMSNQLVCLLIIYRSSISDSG